MNARLWIKVCGLRTVEALEAAADAGANAVGFVFHDPSPRHLGFAQARALAAAVPAGVDKVAVFLHPSQALVDAALDAVRPDWVQTDAADLKALALPAAQRVLPVYRTGRIEESLGARRLLLEAARSGAGELADWNAAAVLARTKELVLAGGLDVANVGAAIASVRPFGVDVSSGVERNRGVKDVALIREFVNAARAAEARLASSPQGVDQR